MVNIVDLNNELEDLKQKLNEDVSGFDDNLLAILMDNLGTMATIYEKPPEAFVKKTKEKYFEDDNEGEYEESQFNLNEDDYNMPKEKEKKETNDNTYHDNFNEASDTFNKDEIIEDKKEQE